MQIFVLSFYTVSVSFYKIESEWLDPVIAWVQFVFGGAATRIRQELFNVPLNATATLNMEMRGAKINISWSFS